MISIPQVPQKNVFRLLDKYMFVYSPVQKKMTECDRVDSGLAAGLWHSSSGNNRCDRIYIPIIVTEFTWIIMDNGDGWEPAMWTCHCTDMMLMIFIHCIVYAIKQNIKFNEEEKSLGLVRNLVMKRKGVFPEWKIWNIPSRDILPSEEGDLNA